MRAAAHLALALALAGPCAACPTPARDAPPVAPLARAEDAARVDVVHVGSDAGRGNLLGLQPWLVPADYAAPERLFAKLDGWLDDARAQGLVGDRTVVVLPEYAGAWLVVAGEDDDGVAAPTIGDALTALALAHPIDFARALASSPADDDMAYAAFASKAAAMARAHVAVFGALAREHRVVVTGASTLLPRPRVVAGAIVVEEGAPLENVVFTFHPDGRLDERVVRKVYPTKDEQPFVSAAPVDALPVIDTPAGRLGVLVCADSWYPAPYEVLRARGAQLLAVPVFLGGDGAWSSPWLGYSGHAPPDDVEARDVRALTEGDAWRKYSVTGRAPAHGFTRALSVTLRGALWDLGDDGAPLAVRDEERARIDGRDGPLLVSLWL